MAGCVFSVTFAAEPGSDRDLSWSFRTDDNQIFMLDHGIIGRTEFIVTGALHFPWIIEISVCTDTGIGNITDVVYPDSIFIGIKIHFLERMQVFSDFICRYIVSFDTVKIMSFRIIHHFNFFIQVFLCQLFDGDREYPGNSHALTRKGNGQVDGGVLRLEYIYVCFVTVDFDSIVVRSYGDFFIIKDILAVLIFDTSISWQLNVTGAGFRINYRRCSVINKIGDLIILVQNCFEFSFSRSRFSGTFYSYGKWHADRINIRYFFNLFVHDRFICRECSGQCNFRIFNRLIDHTGCSVERRIDRRLLDADHIWFGRSPADG